tara:strand:+ start:2416 stop:3063 length:648 start_codon:yes stop_codon:yes gene_type:complete
MQTVKLFIALIISTVGVASAADGYAPDGKYLNVVILTLPARYLADVPIEERVALLTQLSSSPFKDDRLDYDHGWLHWYSDSPDSPEVTSMFWLKLLPKKNGKWVVFVHMSKPFSTNGGAPEKNQTFVLQRNGIEWEDVTASVIPNEVDLTMHFRPRRESNVIQVASYEQFERQDGRGLAYRFGPRKLDLVWDEGEFSVQESDSPKLFKDTIKPSE